MSKVERVRCLLNERLTAAAQEIFALFERTMVEYEEELSLCQNENQRKQRLLDEVLPRVPSPDPGLSQGTTQTVEIKEEPEEQGVTQEEESLIMFVRESSAVFMKTEESPLLQTRQTQHREKTHEDVRSEPHFHSENEGDTDHSSDWEPHNDPPSDTNIKDNCQLPFSCAEAQMETEADGGHSNQVQVRDRDTAAPNSGLTLEYKSAPETSVSVNNGDMSGTDEGAKSKKHQCSVCKKRFKVKQALVRHMTVHTGEKPYSCSICKKAFTQKAGLRKHRRIHTGEKPYSCLICYKEFRNNCNLKTHMRVHTGEKPYSCSLCKKTFIQKGDLDKHSRVHTGERPYSCSICKKTFTLKGNLDKHKRRHTGEKPYSCTICNKTFTQKSHLESHRRIHIGQKSFSCLVCNKDFSESSSLQTHMSSHKE